MKSNALVSYGKIQKAVAKRYPNLNNDEHERLTGILLDEIACRIEAGENIAFIVTRTNGETELTMLGLQILNNRR